MTLLEEKKSVTLLEEYEHVVHQPATKTYDFRLDRTTTSQTAELLPDSYDIPLLTESSSAKKQGLEDAFCIPKLLTPEECNELIAEAEQAGIVPPGKEFGTPRTAKRTDHYENEELSQTITKRLKLILSQRFTRDPNSNKWFGDFQKVHSNWRIVRYDSGDTFPAHQDQMDSMQVLDKAMGVKDFVVSTHTLLINLTPPNVKVNPNDPLPTGGATRFYPNAKLGASTTLGQYEEESVDVWLPQGWAIAFPQLGLVHAGQPISPESSSSKYIAQAGLLRVLPKGQLCRPSVFKLGPGVPRP